jgi:prepilin-type N-terminal cleavage/methylation domain-containing protein
MFKQLKRKQQEGFTIIEVLIVLAIAGLIMLIVFLAVPALQRNSRNTQRKNDVAGLLGAFSEYSNNNGGKVPDTIVLGSAAPAGCVVNNGTWILSLGACSATNPATPVNLGYFTAAGTVKIANCATAGCGVTADTGVAQIETNAVCSGNVITNVGASGRNIAVLYAVEPGIVPQCQQS